MNYIVRDKSVITDKENLKPIFTFKNFPVFIGCTEKTFDTDLKADLSFAICPETGVIQLNKVLPLDVVYSQYHSEAIGKTWTDHHLAFVDFISQFKPKNVLEIGGSNGFIGKNYIDKVEGSNWSIIEPNPSPDIDSRIKVIQKIFDKNIKIENDSIDAIVHSHVFEHIYYPKDFLSLISSNLANNQYHLFSVPNLYEWLKSKFTNCMNFEHTIFLTEYLIDYLLSIYGFKIIKKDYFNNHSIFYATQKTNPYSFNFESKYDEYLKLFNEYIEYLQNKVKKYNNEIKEYEGKIYLFGAHVFSQVLLNLGLEEDKISFILDNSLIKQEKRLYGYNLIIKSPEVIKNDKNATVILNAGVYQDEIKNQLRLLNKEVIILE